MTPHEAFTICEKEKRKNPKLENIILTDPYYSYRYARFIIKRRFEKGEKIIANDLDCSYHYAVFVLKKPFPLCHPIIFNSEYRNKYFDFLKSINYDLKEIEEWLI